MAIGRSGLALLLLAWAAPSRAQSVDVMSLVHASRWADAEAAVADDADPVARKLVTYFRLQTPAGANASEIDSFMQQNPDWPNQAGLARRREEALAVEPDDPTALALCGRIALHGAAALSHCADVQAAAGQTADAGANARKAWIAGLDEPTMEQNFMARWGTVITPEDQWLRFQRQTPGDAARQALRLDGAHRQAADALLALRHDDPRADALYPALPQALRDDPAVMLEQARHLRRQGQDDAALALWTASGAAAQSAAPADRQAGFWAERAMLARLLLRDTNDRGAYAVAAGYDPTGHASFGGEVVVDAEFLSGWIALRRLHDPVLATKHFARLQAVSTAAITQGRAHYWLARAAAAHGDDAAAKAEYARAAQWPSTFYGQLAALTLDGKASGSDALYAGIKGLHDPAWAPEQALDFAGREVARAAALLVAWGDSPRARPFLLRLVELAPDPADGSLAARLAAGLGMPEQAVMIARRAGLQGLVLLESGWPTPYDPPSNLVEPAISLGLMRQESSFDAQATSASGARGLMQLMPATARAVARQAGGGDFGALAGDPADNMRLGVFYMHTLLDQFGDALPLAVAAYNAGPNRVQQWLAQNGDPRSAEATAIGGAADMIDWIELIPFNETRNYVQRVIENVVVYRARLGDNTPHPLARWLG